MNKLTRILACSTISLAHPNFDRKAESDLASNGGFRPESFAGQYLYGMPELIALDRQLTLREQGYPIKLAGEEATRLHRAITAHPDADQIALVTLMNGNRFALPADEIDLSSGFSSGLAVREALIVDLRNLRERIARLIEQSAQIVGEFDEG